MKGKAAILILMVMLLVAGGGVWYGRSKSVAPPANIPEKASFSGQSNATDFSNWKIYKNEKYGFEFKYPEDVIVHENIVDYQGGDTIVGLSKGSQGLFSLKKLDPSRYKETPRGYTLLNLPGINSNKSCGNQFGENQKIWASKRTYPSIEGHVAEYVLLSDKKDFFEIVTNLDQALVGLNPDLLGRLSEPLDQTSKILSTFHFINGVRSVPFDCE